jgi:Excalibur calcium-binding domain
VTKTPQTKPPLTPEQMKKRRIINAISLSILGVCALCCGGVAINAAVSDDKPKAAATSAAPRELADAAGGLDAAPTATPTPTATTMTPTATPSPRTTRRATPQRTTSRPQPKPTTTKPRPATKRPKPSPTSKKPAAVYYKNCAAVRAAGADPIRRGDPGYAKHLDRDGDGVGCE